MKKNKQPKFIMIAAHDNNFLIGNKNELPWNKIKKDMILFRKITNGNKVLMGMNTFKSILSYNNKPLPNRTSIVLSRSADETFKKQYPDVIFIDSVESMLERFGNETIYIIGGTQIYNLFYNYTDAIISTHIKHEFSGDAYLIDYTKDFFKIDSFNLNDSGYECDVILSAKNIELDFSHLKDMLRQIIF